MKVGVASLDIPIPVSVPQLRWMNDHAMDCGHEFYVHRGAQLGERLVCKQCGESWPAPVASEEKTG